MLIENNSRRVLKSQEELHYSDTGNKTIVLDNINKDRFMTNYAIIAENDVSQWKDQTGESYHFPKRYLKILTPGCKVIYYKGKLKDKSFSASRLSDQPHYFGIASIGQSVKDPSSSKNDYFCEVLDFQKFSDPVLAKINNEYLETIPESKKRNYWRDGARKIDHATYEKITSLANICIKEPRGAYNTTLELESTGTIEGNKIVRYSTYYERNPYNRAKAIEIHGCYCHACGFDFEKVYGEIGKGYIQVHHINPISETGPIEINPSKDLIPLCSNCHSIVHRNKNYTLNIEELKSLTKSN